MIEGGNMEFFSLNGKTALITGSSQGIGYVLAKGLAKAGATVILNGRDKIKLSKSLRNLKIEKVSVSV